MKERRLSKEIKKYLNHKNAIVVIGARQVGKTSLLRMIYEDINESQKIWFDLDNPLHRLFFEEIDYEDIYKELLNKGLDPKKRKFVFIDEIQSFPEITKIMKYLIDHHEIKFLVTGSSSFYLKNLFPESLSGRKFEFKLETLDFGEFLYFKGITRNIKEFSLDLKEKKLSEYEKFDKEFEEFMNYGSFPEVSLASSIEEKKMILENIFKSFFQMDILQIAQYKDVKEIRDLILLLSRRVGSRLDVSKLASELSVQRYKIYAYLEFLQAIFLVDLISPYSKQIDRSIAAGKKIYFLDTGLLNQIAKIGEGELFENAVYNLIKRYGEINYYNHKKEEIDFILNGETAFEAKLTGTFPYYKKLKKISEKLKIQDAFLISKNFLDIKKSKEEIKVLYPQQL